LHRSPGAAPQATKKSGTLSQENQLKFKLRSQCRDPTMKKTALIRGITSLDGAYLAAQSRVGVSIEEPGYAANSDGMFIRLR